MTYRAQGVEKCVKCGDMHTFNHYYFPIYFMEELRLDSDLVCRFCLGLDRTYDEEGKKEEICV